jgi:hypothetical protein
VGGAVPVGAGVWPRKIAAHFRARFVDRAISRFHIMVFAGEKFLAAKFTKRDQHRRNYFYVGDCGLFGVCLPKRILPLDFFISLFGTKRPAAISRAAGAGIGCAVGWIVDRHYLFLAVKWWSGQFFSVVFVPSLT